MATTELLFEKSGSCASIVFNRPDVHNAMNWAMYDRLESVCDEIDADADIRVVTLRGAGGKAFVAGTDIGQFRDFDSGADAMAYEKRIDRVISRLEHLKRPTIAMLQGVCAGGGAAIALACDFRYADENLRLGIPIAKTLGNCLSMANFARLVDLLGTAKAKEMLMLGRMFRAEECRAAGAVNAVFPADKLEAKVAEIAADLAAVAPLTVRATKAAIQRIHEARRIPLEDGEDLIRSCYTSEDFHGAVAAFMEKSQYEWQGR
jgi:enoyl-CoA hydratase/carnithine racemase